MTVWRVTPDWFLSIHVSTDPDEESALPRWSNLSRLAPCSHADEGIEVDVLDNLEANTPLRNGARRGTAKEVRNNREA